ncbi:SRPBCC family protein [Sphingobium sufflavum]|uniref:CoxG family protein n=1 Tax=Sphingobium sufflavum TaxID=1129547 RepID=UPI001F1E517E|nr:SRPBCC family protein [Sphingobium sufflavum]MCE7796571.1 SRPBCC family protein [Sphingobium sufflavum]
MIETEQSIIIDAPIESVWCYAEDINSWASLMPGLQNCEIVDGNVSRWTLKVGVGALVRTVNVAVHVDRWAGPNAVDFRYSLERDPVEGGGTYRARSVSEGQTEIALSVRVTGTGPMAPMWEAMGKPLLPKFARAFAEQFKEEVEKASPPTNKGEPKPKSVSVRLLAWLRRFLGGQSSAA